jgi:hypothetical protein
VISLAGISTVTVNIFRVAPAWTISSSSEDGQTSLLSLCHTEEFMKANRLLVASGMELKSITGRAVGKTG